MNTNHINEDNILKKILNEAGTESPSANFTNNIMSKLKPYPVLPKLVYKPLISVKGWVLIWSAAIASLLIAIFVPFKSSSNPYNWKLPVIFDDVAGIMADIFHFFISISSHPVIGISVTAFMLLLFVDMIIHKVNINRKLK